MKLAIITSNKAIAQDYAKRENINYNDYFWCYSHILLKGLMEVDYVVLPPFLNKETEHRIMHEIYVIQSRKPKESKQMDARKKLSRLAKKASEHDIKIKKLFKIKALINNSIKNGHRKLKKLEKDINDIMEEL